MPAEFGQLEPHELPDVTSLLCDAFAGTREGTASWTSRHAAENVRVLRPGGQSPHACMFRIPMAQWFGGRAVPMVGIAGVAVGLQSRGKGLARDMMTRAVQELAAEGVPLSALYASTRPLYRSVGYEAAGSRHEISIPIRELPAFPNPLPVRELSTADQPEMTELHRAWAEATSGMPERPANLWDRAWKNRDEPFRAFGVVAPGGQLEGYVMLAQRRKPDNGRQDVALSDFVATTPRAARTLSTFLAGFTTMGDSLIFFGAVNHPLLMLMPHPAGEVRLYETWMLRITSVPAALAARGYHRHAAATITLDVHDPIAESNNALWTLSLREGSPRVDRGSAPGAEIICIDIKGLAALYASYMSPAELARLDLMAGPKGAMDAAAAIFAGPAPSMSDFF